MRTLNRRCVSGFRWGQFLEIFLKTGKSLWEQIYNPLSCSAPRTYRESGLKQLRSLEHGYLTKSVWPKYRSLTHKQRSLLKLRSPEYFENEYTRGICSRSITEVLSLCVAKNLRLLKYHLPLIVRENVPLRTDIEFLTSLVEWLKFI